MRRAFIIVICVLVAIAWLVVGSLQRIYHTYVINTISARKTGSFLCVTAGKAVRYDCIKLEFKLTYLDSASFSLSPIEPGLQGPAQRLEHIQVYRQHPTGLENVSTMLQNTPECTGFECTALAEANLRDLASFIALYNSRSSKISGTKLAQEGISFALPSTDSINDHPVFTVKFK
jgi:hypothetical protein